MDEIMKHNKQDDCWMVIGNDKTGKRLQCTRNAIALIFGWKSFQRFKRHFIYEKG